MQTTAPFRLFATLCLALTLSACALQPAPSATEPAPPVEAAPPTPEPVPPLSPVEPRPPQPAIRKPRIGLALGGGAARGYAHIGVIKALEAQGIVPDFIAGTSAGAVVGALYAAGLNGFQLQRIGMDLDEDTLADWSFPKRGLLKGEALQDFVNRKAGQRPMERLDRPFAAVATDLKNGEMVVFRRGDTGMAVRASSAVPGVFKPVPIRDREYVDGGLTSPVPVRAVKAMGADFVIAVDVGNKPQWGQSDGMLDVLLRTFTIMGASIGKLEMAEADVVIRPVTPEVAATDFDARHYAILAGEKAAAGVMAGLKAKLEQARGR